MSAPAGSNQVCVAAKRMSARRRTHFWFVIRCELKSEKSKTAAMIRPAQLSHFETVQCGIIAGQSTMRL